MDEVIVKILLYALGILAALIGITASIYKIREAKIRLHAHKAEEAAKTPAPTSPSPSRQASPSKAELKAHKKLAKQRAKEIKKGDQAP